MNTREVWRYLRGLSHEEFVLHGSPYLTEVLEPRQANCLGPDGTVDKEKSQLGVYTSLWVRDAVVCAIVRKHAGWKVSEDLKTLTVLGDSATLASGFLYVLPQKNFTRLSNRFWFISKEQVRPTRTLSISPDILKYLSDIVLPPHLTRPI